MSDKTKNYIGVLDSTDPKDIEEMDRALFGDDFVEELKKKAKEAKEKETAQ
jgi:CCR4-NOT transcriptional regulation complex NOT5 subunit